MEPISRYELVDGKIRIFTPYSEMVISQCRKWSGKWDGKLGCWTVPASRLEAVRKLLGNSESGYVEIEIRRAQEADPENGLPEPRQGYEVTDNAYHLGWHIIATRGGRDRAADVHAELTEGEIPDTGGSMKYPLVAGKGCAFRLWVPKDFAADRGLTIVTDPTAVPAESPVAAKPDPLNEYIADQLSTFTDDDLRNELARRAEYRSETERLEELDGTTTVRLEKNPG